MGYYVTGNITVEGAHSAETVLALSYQEGLGSIHEWHLNKIEESSPRIPLARRTLESVGFDCVSDEVTPQGVQHFGFQYDGKWTKSVETVFELLASSGFIVTGDFVGEDDYAWRISTEDGSISEHSLVRVPAKDIEQWAKNSEMLDAVRMLISQPQHVDSPLAADIRAALGNLVNA